MSFELIFRGLLLGFSIAAPVGPIGVLCVRRTLAEGRLSGLATGLGAATADACYGLLAGLGVGALGQALHGSQGWLRLPAGLFLLYLGVRAFRAGPAQAAAAPDGRGLLLAYGSTFLLTLSNPLTILSFAAAFAGVGAGLAVGPSGAVWLVLGVFLGSALWWLLLSGVVSLLRRRVDARALVWVNRISGVVIMAFGVAALVRL